MNGEKYSNDNKSIQILQTQLKGEIEQMISNWISKRNLQSDDVKSLLHILCPKCKQDIDDALSQKNTDRLKEIITNSIYNEMTGFLLEGCEIIKLYTEDESYNSIIIKLPDDNRCLLEVKGAHIGKRNEKFMFLDIDIEKNGKKVSFQDCEKFLYVSFIKDKHSKTIGILNSCNLQSKILTVEQEEEKELDSYFDFVKTLSFCEMEIYQKNFTDGIPTMTVKTNPDGFPSKQDIINAMKKAQKAVEDIRNKKEEEKKDKRENSTQLTNNTPTYTLCGNFGKNKYIGHDENGVWHCCCI